MTMSGDKASINMQSLRSAAESTKQKATSGTAEAKCMQKKTRQSCCPVQEAASDEHTNVHA